MNLRIYQESENVIVVLENASSLKDKIVPFLEKDVLAYITIFLNHMGLIYFFQLLDQISLLIYQELL